MQTDLYTKFEELLNSTREYNENADIDTLRKAFEFAKIAHSGEKRLSGEDFVIHPLETATILVSWKMDTATVVAALLHDTIEHGAANERDLFESFGKEVAELVEGVSKVSRVKIKGNETEVFVENLRKMFLAMAEDLRIVFIRIAERIDNLKSLEYLPEDRRRNYAIDSLEIYGILAERLGMWDAKKKIDNSAFKFAYPEEYQKVVKISQDYYKHSEEILKKVKRTLITRLNEQGVAAKISARKKDLFSLYSKLKRPENNWSMNTIHDIIALRVITELDKDCYIALGVVHKSYKPVPHLEVGDFIARPKPNGYRSIHTRVIGPEGRIVEIQIRTRKMHEEAEMGAAAHWQMNVLKKSGKLTSKSIDEGKWVVPEKLKWVKELSEWQKDIKDSAEFLKAVKFDALAKRIFALSPEGDAYDLPVNSTPVDFAYAVHTDLGKYIAGAKADGKIVPLNYLLNNGQVVEIIKSKNPKRPNQDWLDFTVTTMARREIKKQLKKEGSL